MGWMVQSTRHAAAMFSQRGNPAARVYESIESDFILTQRRFDGSSVGEVTWLVTNYPERFGI
jgi:hypothetical protein